MIEFTFSEIARDHMARRGYDARDMLGDLPLWLNASDPAGAVEQIDRMYRPIGGGWKDHEGFRLSADRTELFYPADPPTALIASAKLRDEQVLVFDSDWVAVVQVDGSMRVARID